LSSSLRCVPIRRGVARRSFRRLMNVRKPETQGGRRSGRRRRMISPGSSGTILLEDALDAATRFLDAVDESIEAICQMPHMGAQKPLKNPLLSGLRSWTVRDFETSSFFTSSSLTPCASFAFCTANRWIAVRRQIRRSQQPSPTEGGIE